MTSQKGPQRVVTVVGDGQERKILVPRGRGDGWEFTDEATPVPAPPAAPTKYSKPVPHTTRLRFMKPNRPRG